MPSLGHFGQFSRDHRRGPAGESKEKILFIKGRNGLVRKVDISGAAVVYEASVPEAQRQKTPVAALKSGIEVRITAEQGDGGEWKATESRSSPLTSNVLSSVSDQPWWTNTPASPSRRTAKTVTFLRDFACP